eukprot:jgi/Mesvir1/5027/Mv02235-RA.2
MATTYGHSEPKTCVLSGAASATPSEALQGAAAVRANLDGTADKGVRTTAPRCAAAASIAAAVLIVSADRGNGGGGGGGGGGGSGGGDAATAAAATAALAADTWAAQATADATMASTETASAATAAEPRATRSSACGRNEDNGGCLTPPATATRKKARQSAPSVALAAGTLAVSPPRDACMATGNGTGVAVAAGVATSIEEPYPPATSGAGPAPRAPADYDVQEGMASGAADCHGGASIANQSPRQGQPQQQQQQQQGTGMGDRRATRGFLGAQGGAGASKDLEEGASTEGARDKGKTCGSKAHGGVQMGGEGGEKGGNEAGEAARAAWQRPGSPGGEPSSRRDGIPTRGSADPPQGKAPEVRRLFEDDPASPPGSFPTVLAGSPRRTRSKTRAARSASDQREAPAAPTPTATAATPGTAVADATLATAVAAATAMTVTACTAEATTGNVSRAGQEAGNALSMPTSGPASCQSMEEATPGASWQVSLTPAPPQPVPTRATLRRVTRSSSLVDASPAPSAPFPATRVAEAATAHGSAQRVGDGITTGGQASPIAPTTAGAGSHDGETSAAVPRADTPTAAAPRDDASAAAPSASGKGPSPAQPSAVVMEAIPLGMDAEQALVPEEANALVAEAVSRTLNAGIRRETRRNNKPPVSTLHSIASPSLVTSPAHLVACPHFVESPPPLVPLDAMEAVDPRASPPHETPAQVGADPAACLEEGMPSGRGDKRGGDGGCSQGEQARAQADEGGPAMALQTNLSLKAEAATHLPPHEGSTPCAAYRSTPESAALLAFAGLLWWPERCGEGRYAGERSQDADDVSLWPVVRQGCLSSWDVMATSTQRERWGVCDTDGNKGGTKEPGRELGGDVAMPGVSTGTAARRATRATSQDVTGSPPAGAAMPDGKEPPPIHGLVGMPSSKGRTTSAVAKQGKKPSPRTDLVPTPPQEPEEVGEHVVASVDTLAERSQGERRLSGHCTPDRPPVGSSSRLQTRSRVTSGDATATVPVPITTTATTTVAATAAVAIVEAVINMAGTGLSVASPAEGMDCHLAAPDSASTRKRKREGNSHPGSNGDPEGAQVPAPPTSPAAPRLPCLATPPSRRATRGNSGIAAATAVTTANNATAAIATAGAAATALVEPRSSPGPMGLCSQGGTPRKTASKGQRQSVSPGHASNQAPVTPPPGPTADTSATPCHRGTWRGAPTAAQAPPPNANKKGKVLPAADLATRSRAATGSAESDPSKRKEALAQHRASVPGTPAVAAPPSPPTSAVVVPPSAEQGKKRKIHEAATTVINESTRMGQAGHATTSRIRQAGHASPTGGLPPATGVIPPRETRAASTRAAAVTRNNATPPRETSVASPTAAPWHTATVATPAATAVAIGGVDGNGERHCAASALAHTSPTSLPACPVGRCTRSSKSPRQPAVAECQVAGMDCQVAVMDSKCRVPLVDSKQMEGLNAEVSPRRPKRGRRSEPPGLAAEALGREEVAETADVTPKAKKRTSKPERTSTQAQRVAAEPRSTAPQSRAAGHRPTRDAVAATSMSAHPSPSASTASEASHHVRASEASHHNFSNTHDKASRCPPAAAAADPPLLSTTSQEDTQTDAHACAEASPVIPGIVSAAARHVCCVVEKIVNAATDFLKGVAMVEHVDYSSDEIVGLVSPVKGNANDCEFCARDSERSDTM